MMGNNVEFTYPPKRIISLVPSQTELLYDLGLDGEVVGITKFCVHPDAWYRNKKRVGGTKTVHIDIINAIRPDLIIANKEENTKEQVTGLSMQYPVWVSDIQTADAALHMIREVGGLTGRAQQAILLADEITEGFRTLKKATVPKRVAYFIWRAPWMCAGGDTFISNMIEKMGWENVLASQHRYPQISLGELADKKVDLVLLSSEPYPFKEAHIAEIKAVLPRSRCIAGRR